MTLTLVASDGARFEIEEELIQQSQLLSNLLIDLGQANQSVPISNVSGSILSKVIEFMKYHEHDHTQMNNSATIDEYETLSEQISEWDRDFMKMDQGSLFEIILAANFLELKQLLDLSCKTVANMIKGKSVEEMRQTFNVKNDFTPQEEEYIRKEFEW